MDDFGGAGQVSFYREGRAGVITLNRPEALNALTHGMVRAMAAALDTWETDPGISAVIIRAEGRAFCAGGDIQAIYRAGKAGEPLYDFFADEYRLNARIESYPKPYVALIDGIVMGGGVGVSIHGSHRVFTENARFAMPEVTIGFFPDVGGSRFLPRLPGCLGMWLGLTGSRLGWAGAIRCGLASHAVSSARMNDLVTDLCAGQDPDAVLQRYSENPSGGLDDGTIEKIGDMFSATTLTGLLEELREASGRGDNFADETLGKMARASPTSLHVAFRQIRSGAQLTMRQCMIMEFRIVNRMLQGHDFYEGIRAAVIDKDGAPRWQPANLQEIENAAIDRYFEPLQSGDLDFGASSDAAVMP